VLPDIVIATSWVLSSALAFAKRLFEPKKSRSIRARETSYVRETLWEGQRVKRFEEMKKGGKPMSILDETNLERSKSRHMKVLIVFDSVYGNTEKIGKAIGDAIGGEVKVLRVGEVNSSELKTFDLLVVGSPTQGGRPTPAIQGFLNKISEPVIRGINVAAFDTRLSTRLVRIFGYAAGRIADSLKRNGGTLIASPEGFFVKGNKGPLKEGELERAARWAKEIAE